MKRTLLLTVAAFGLGACTSSPEPISDYNAPYYGKGDKAPAAAPRPEPRPTPLCVAFPWLCPDDDTPRTPRTPPSEPPSTPPSEPPSKPERQKGNNGLGNGDQTAPGNSLGHNRAENERGNPGHKSGKAQNSN